MLVIFGCYKIEEESLLLVGEKEAVKISRFSAY
jgi:hypothetical protein